MFPRALIASLSLLPVVGDPPSAALFLHDLNGDGRDDAVVLQPGASPRLMRATASGGFADLSATAGLPQRDDFHLVLVHDIDNDTRPDLLLASYTGAAVVLLQSEGGSFVDATARVGLDGIEGVVHAHFVELGGDARTDLHLVTLVGDRLLRQGANGLYVEVELGLAPRAALANTPATVDEARRSLGLPPATPGREATAPGRRSAGGALTTSTGAQVADTFLCPFSMQDSANPGTCVPASSVPTFGALYPLGPEFFIEASSGNVGVGTMQPGARLDVAGGDVRTDGQLVSTWTGGPPLAVSSSDKVNGLNADQLDGLHAESFTQLGQKIGAGEIEADAVGSSEILDGSVTSSDLAPGAVGAGAIAVGSITGLEIADGSLTDADVSTTTPIQGSKIVPDFGSQAVVTTAEVSAASFRLANDDDTGLTSPAPGEVGLSTQGVERFRVQSDGRTWMGQPGIIGAPRLSVHSSVVPSTGALSTGVLGHHDSTDGAVVGLHGWATSPFASTGVLGWSTGASQAGMGTRGYSESDDGTGVRGETPAFGNGTGVVGLGGATGVYGATTDPLGNAIHGIGNSVDPGSYVDGVVGEAWQLAGYGIWGKNTAGGYGVYASGDLGASGVKSFVQPHPTDASKQVRFVCLEGNEAGTYFRGRGRLSGGRALIDVPEEFAWVTDPSELTVQLTAKGPALLWYESADLEIIQVRGSADVEFDYLVQGVRLGFRDVELVQTNRAYRPTERGVEFQPWLPDALRELLVDNGTLNPDYTPNEPTAAQLGWELAEPRREEARLQRILAERQELQERAASTAERGSAERSGRAAGPPSARSSGGD